MILNQVQRRQKQEEEEQLETTIAQIADKDPFNMASDEYYFPKNVQRSIGSGAAVQHSIPAQNIHSAIFPTHLTPQRLRHFRRAAPPYKIMRPYLQREARIKTANRHANAVDERRRQQAMAEGGGGNAIFHMRTLNDLTALDGKLLFIEYSEEHPPLFNQPGMSSKIRNYYKRVSFLVV